MGSEDFDMLLAVQGFLENQTINITTKWLCTLNEIAQAKVISTMSNTQYLLGMYWLNVNIDTFWSPWWLMEDILVPMDLFVCFFTFFFKSHRD